MTTRIISVPRKRSFGRVAAVAVLVWLSAGVPSNAEGPTFAASFDKYVAADGKISVPENYRETFTYLGTFSQPGDRTDGGQAEFHHVYIDRDSVAVYRKTGAFPDGAVIVKELQGLTSADLTTGFGSFWDKDKGWFVMIKDTKGRYPGSPLWGKGWGWALFDAADPKTPTTKDFEADCIGCHTPVKATDWIHVWAYPLLDAKDKFSTFDQ